MTSKSKTEKTRNGIKSKANSGRRSPPKIDPHIVVREAYHNGAVIEWFNEFHQEWVICTGTGFAVDFVPDQKFRIAAPELQKPKRR